MENTFKELAEKLVNSINDSESDYDAIELAEGILKQNYPEIPTMESIELVEVILKQQLPIHIHEGIYNTHVEVTKEDVTVKVNDQ